MDYHPTHLLIMIAYEVHTQYRNVVKTKNYVVKILIERADV